jgi:hypothetical protein
VSSATPAFGRADAVDGVEVGRGVFVAGVGVSVAIGVSVGSTVGLGVFVGTGVFVGVGVAVAPDGVDSKAGPLSAALTTKFLVNVRRMPVASFQVIVTV